MAYRQPSGPRRIPTLVVAAVVVVAAAAAVPGYRLLASSSSTAGSPVAVRAPSSTTASPSDVLHTQHLGAPVEADGVLPKRNGGALGEADGAVRDGTTVLDGDIPAVAKLDPALLGALRRAATDAGQDGVDFVVTSGWRSRAYEEQLRQEAVAKYGSEKEAARWVATPDTSAHVTGDAVDLGPATATAWLSKHGARYGLCQIYRNEPWHYELRPHAVEHGCPALYADPTQDPRMQP